MRVLYGTKYYDSELEVNYQKYIEELISKGEVEFSVYHPAIKIQVTSNNWYTPDFIVYYKNGNVEIIETKGYNQFSFMKDNMIHNIMLNKSEEELKLYLLKNQLPIENRHVVYKKVKYLKSYGFVNWDFKNPNTIANKRKEKINDLEEDIKSLKEFKKNALRYFNLERKPKLNEAQKQFMSEFKEKVYKELEN